MPRLKSRSEFPPSGFTYIQSETGFNTWDTLKHQSFKAVVDAVVAHRLGNPHIGDKVGWRTDYAGVADEVDDYVARLNVIQGYPQFVVDGGGEPPPFYRPLAGLANRLSGAAAASSRIVAGVGTLLDWLGDGGEPVKKELAEKRAGICVTCPQNGKGDWKRIFTAPVAHKIKLQLAIKHDMDLKTSHDAQLGVCLACDCPLELKTQIDIKYIAAHTSEEVYGKFDPRCWILSETGRTKNS